MNLAELRERLEALATSMAENDKAKAGFDAALHDATLRVKGATDAAELAELEKEADELAAQLVETEKLAKDLAREADSIESVIKAEEAEMAAVKTQAAKALAASSAKRGNASDYLASKQSVIDFGKHLQKMAGHDAAEVKAAWEANVRAKGDTGLGILLPQAVVTKITDTFESAGSIWSTFDHTGLSVYQHAVDTNDGDTARARGYNRVIDETKREQNVNLVDKVIRPQFIYKYKTIPKELQKENQDTGALIEYVLRELPQRILMEVERAALIGDGRQGQGLDADKIYSFEPVASGSDLYHIEVAGTGDLWNDFTKLDEQITAEGARYFACSRETLGNLRRAKDGDGRLLYQPGTNFAEIFGVAKLFTPSWWPTDGRCVEWVGPAYKTVGDRSIDAYSNFTLATNKLEYLQELWAGGALMEYKSGGYIGPVGG